MWRERESPVEPRTAPQGNGTSVLQPWGLNFAKIQNELGSRDRETPSSSKIRIGLRGIQTTALKGLRTVIFAPGSHPDGQVRSTLGILGSSKRGPEQRLREGLEPKSIWKGLTPEL